MEDKKICDGCGATLNNNENKCPYCGKEFNEVTKEEKVEESNQPLVQQSKVLENNQPFPVDNFEPMKPKKSKKGLIIAIIAVVILIAGLVGGFIIMNNNSDSDEPETTEKNNDKKKKNQSKTDDKKEGTKEETKKDDTVKEKKSIVEANPIIDLDLDILKLENKEENVVYSPISLKYVLKMLEDGADNETKTQISSVLNNYKISKYVNSENMSIANALFIKDSYKKNILNSYINNLKTNYGADVIYDSFSTPNKVNDWVSNKTFKLINNMFDDINSEDFILVNTAAIDMEWVKPILEKMVGGGWGSYFDHTNYKINVRGYYTVDSDGMKEKFDEILFNNKKVNSLPLAGYAFNYDIVSDLGEENIRNAVGTAYNEYKANGGIPCFGEAGEKETDKYLDNYIKSLQSYYQRSDSSTDFEFYIDDNIKVFAKDLKEYNGVTLQYVGIMPTNKSLANYINDLTKDSLIGTIKKIKPLKSESFKDGVVTQIDAKIPVFKMEYELNLKNDLSKLGITDVFDITKSNLSKLSSQNNANIDKIKQKINLEFSNEGIKAAAVTTAGGRGAGGCGFKYNYDVPVEYIDLTFDKPYLYLIRNKDTGEIWFIGTVYNPTEYTV